MPDVRPPGDVLRDQARREAEAARERAFAALTSGDLDTSLVAYDESLSCARRTGDDAFVDWIYACRAAAVAEASPAGDELVELKRILLRGRDAQTAFRAAYTAARVYELRRDYRKALFYNRIARQHADELEDGLLAVGCANQGATLLVVDSRFDEAAEAYRRALELAGTEPRVPELYRALLKDNLGYCLIASDRVPDGLSLVHEALGTIEGLGARSQTVFPLLDLCFGYLKANRFEEARYFGEEGLDRCAGCNDPTVEKNLLYLLGEACHLSGDASAAEGYFDRLASLYPEFRNLRAYLDVFDFRNVINLRS
ncbi:hypothetical protein FBQ97_01090 [Acidobacteria bacterium ACD]|nr:hypothetical protein [Acidobacteria bacterium ACD]